jgi:hypothetical protein
MPQDIGLMLEANLDLQQVDQADLQQIKILVGPTC